MRKATLLLVFAAGCIEYTPSSTLPPAGVPKGRPLEVSSNTDKLVQVTTPEVDILWVIDNSCSMLEEQTALANNFPTFMAYFLDSGLDYHIGVTSTDMDLSGSGNQGQLREYGAAQWIDPQTANPTDFFVGVSVLGNGGSADERGRDAAYRQLEVHSGSGGVNEGFARDGASLHLVMISDEDDFSRNITVAEYIDYLQNLKSDPDMVTSSSIVSPEGLVGCPSSLYVQSAGYNYVAVTQAVGGINWSICTSDWQGLLEQLGLQASGMKREYFLSDLPVPGTIKVWVKEDGQRMNFEEGTDWTYDQVRNSILFSEFVPTALSEVFVKYDLLGESDHI